MNTPLIRSERLLIRPFTEADLKAFSRYRANPAVAKFQSWSDFSYADALALFQTIDYANFGAIGHWCQLAIADSTSNQLLGDLAVQFIDAQQIEIGFTVAPEHQRKHVAKEAITALLDYMFDTLKQHRVIATTDVENIASYRLLEGLGFTREAHFRQNIYFKGAWGDEYQYAMLRSEYKR